MVVLEPSPEICKVFDITYSPVCVLECDVPRLTLLSLVHWKAKQHFRGQSKECTWKKLCLIPETGSGKTHKSPTIEEILLRIGPCAYPTLLQSLLRRGLPDPLARVVDPIHGRCFNCVDVVSDRVPTWNPYDTRSGGDARARCVGHRDQHPAVDSGRLLCRTVE